MKLMSIPHKAQERGFTLIEVILTLVISGILAVLLTTYTSKSLSRSTVPGQNLRKTLALYSVMEKMRFDYDNNTDLSLNDIKTKIGASGSSMDNSYGKYYVAYNQLVDYDDFSPTPADTPPGIEMLMVTICDEGQKDIRVDSLFSE